MPSRRIRSNEAILGQLATQTNPGEARVLGESGVYPSPEERRATRRTPAWDDDEEITNVYHPAPVATAPIARRRSVRQAPSQLWQISMRLTGDELTRLWLQNWATFGGKMSVWSKELEEWVELQAPLRSHRHVDQQQFTAGQSSKRTMTESPRPGSGPTDVSRYAELVAPPTPKGARPWMVAALLGCLSVGVLSGYLYTRPIETSAARAVYATAPLHPTAFAESPSSSPTSSATQASVVSTREPSELVVARVEELPLVTTRDFARMGPPASAKTPTTLDVPRRFDQDQARRALTAALWRTQSCAQGFVDGSALVTFAPTGVVVNVKLATLSGDLSSYECVTDALHTARVAPFTGSAVTVRKSFRVAS